MASQDIGDAVVGNRPGVEEIVGATDNGIDAGIFIKVESRLGLQVFQHIQEHPLKPFVPEVRFVLVLGDSADRHFFPSHKHLLPFSVYV